MVRVRTATTPGNRESTQPSEEDEDPRATIIIMKKLTEQERRADQRRLPIGHWLRHTLQHRGHGFNSWSGTRSHTPWVSPTNKNEKISK